MLKSGKLKLADDMIVTAQEAANKAETVFTIYDDTTNSEIAKGPIGGGGGGDDGWNLVKIENINQSAVSGEINSGYQGTYLVNEARNRKILNVTMVVSYLEALQDDAVKCEAKWTIGDEIITLSNATYQYQPGDVGVWMVTFDYSEVDPPVLLSSPEDVATLTITWMDNEA